MDSIPDILKDANERPESLLKYKANNYLRNLLSAAYLPEKKFDLPEGDPPYKKSGISDQITKGAFWQICRKIDIFYRPNIKPFQRETQFINALESLSPDECTVLLKVKDQALTELYPALTFDKLKEIGYF
jgi:hypothetical protein